MVSNPVLPGEGCLCALRRQQACATGAAGVNADTTAASAGKQTANITTMAAQRRITFT